MTARIICIALGHMLTAAVIIAGVFLANRRRP